MADDSRNTGRMETRCLVAGGGPAGMMLGYLLARAGVEVVVLEKHADFLRDFRGDTVHPSTLEVLAELGLDERFLQRPHQELRHISGQIGKESFRIADFSRLKVKYPFIAFMPQWDFLDFLAEEAAKLPSFRLMMSTEARQLIVEGGRVVGVSAKAPEGEMEIRAGLVVAADGRSSTLRRQAGLEVKTLAAPIDVLWFRVGKQEGAEQGFGHIDRGHVLVTIDRGDYWQCAFVIRKGGAEAVKAGPLEAFRETIAETATYLRPHIDDVKSWDDVKLLSVAVDRLEHWSRPGLLCIGDAAHAMSPIGGVGINMAIQDAVAAANLLAPTLKGGGPVLEAALDGVRRRRQLPTRVVQAVQVFIQNRVVVPTLAGRTLKPPFFLRLLDRWPALQVLPAGFIGIGIRPERIAYDLL
ncbi:MAG TPA: FAD-dependent oxidoreductase [Devosia sp.]|nr:FAD-dependent oxidoreductase [Devosia sp.]